MSAALAVHVNWKLPSDPTTTVVGSWPIPGSAVPSAWVTCTVTTSPGTKSRPVAVTTSPATYAGLSVLTEGVWVDANVRWKAAYATRADTRRARRTNVIGAPVEMGLGRPESL